MAAIPTHRKVKGHEMRVNFAHLHERSIAGIDINFAVFEGRSASGTPQDNALLLTRWTIAARSLQLRVDQSALAFLQNSRPCFYGSEQLVEYLATRGVPRWNYHLDF